MGDGTGISWTDATWNPVRGCSRVSEGCRNCYAERTAARFCGAGQPYEGLAIKRRGSKWTGEVRLVHEHLADALRWRRPRRIFVNSMSDLFHDRLADVDIDQVFAVMLLAPRHTFQVLTKRPARMRSYLTDATLYQRVLTAAGRFRDADSQLNQIAIENPTTRPARWIWWGTSVENQAAADERIPELIATPAAVRFLSCEPLLGPVELRNIDAERAGHRDMWFVDALTGRHDDMGRPCQGLARIDWVIAGCESGPGARPCDVAWLRSLRDQCAAAGASYFLKQAREEPEVCDQGCGERVRYQVIGRDTAIASCGCTIEGGEVCSPVGVASGDDSKRKAGGVIELPYLDGVQHAEFPEVAR